MTPNLLTKSKRWIAASIAMVLMFVVSIPALGIPEEVAADLRTKFSWVVLAFIGGQTVTDAVTKGATSGNYQAPEKNDAPQ